MHRIKRLLLILLIVAATIAAIPLEALPKPAFVQGQPPNTLDLLEDIFRPRPKPAGTRGPICLITPGVQSERSSLGEAPQIWSDRPLFVWQRPVASAAVHLANSNTVIWKQALPPDGRSLLYQGPPLQPGQTYEVIAFGRKNQPLNTGEDAQFTLLEAEQRTQIAKKLAIKAAELEQRNHSEEAIAIANAIEFTNRSLLSDALQVLYSVPNRSPRLNSFLTETSTQVCGQSQPVSTADTETRIQPV